MKQPNKAMIWVDVSSCFPGCMGIMRVEYKFNIPVTEEHFKKAKEYYIESSKELIDAHI